MKRCDFLQIIKLDNNLKSQGNDRHLYKIEDTVQGTKYHVNLNLTRHKITLLSLPYKNKKNINLYLIRYNITS